MHGDEDTSIAAQLAAKHADIAAPATLRGVLELSCMALGNAITTTLPTAGVADAKEHAALAKARNTGRALLPTKPPSAYEQNMSTWPWHIGDGDVC